MRDNLGRPVTSFIDVVAFVSELGKAKLFLGFEPTPEQLALVRAARDRPHVGQGFPPPSRKREDEASPSENSGVTFQSDTATVPLIVEPDGRPAACGAEADAMPRVDLRDMPTPLGGTRTLVDRL